MRKFSFGFLEFNLFADGSEKTSLFPRDIDRDFYDQKRAKDRCEKRAELTGARKCNSSRPTALHRIADNHLCFPC